MIKLRTLMQSNSYWGRSIQDLVREITYPDNFHENFNELNREDVFGEIVKWMEPRI